MVALNAFAAIELFSPQYLTMAVQKQWKRI